MLKTTRAFLAITPPEAIIAELTAQLLPMLANAFGRGLRLVPPTNLHITLKFLGDVKENALRAIQEKMRGAASNIAPFPLRLQKIGAFPAWRNARIVWLGVDVVPDELLSLHHQCEIIAAACGIAREKRCFQPHLTLGRARDILRVEGELSGEMVDFSSKVFIIDSLKLFASKITPTGAHYSLMERFQLQGGKR